MLRPPWLRLQGFDGKRFDAHGKANSWMDLLIAKGSKIGVKAKVSAGPRLKEEKKKRKKKKGPRLPARERAPCFALGSSPHSIHRGGLRA